MIETIWSSLMALTVGNIAILRFYLRHLVNPFFFLPKELYDDVALAKRMSKKEEFALTVDKSFVDGYNRGIDDLKNYVKKLWGPCAQVDYRLKQLLFWLVRFATVAAAFQEQGQEDKNLRRVLLISMLQFIVIPYSLSIALAYGLETVFAIYTGHAIVQPILTVLANAFVPEKYNVAITISPMFLATFLIIDQLLCFYTLFRSPA